eukprot:CAMPEP_0198258628 /NCGR_PEP_ID=MMETSP1447-20131203/7993_1 /TAXON_ID=420782 /ORGANISM="Chaetoceros dichaeta, Strain CCMP1751" /LENGTH=349 /DNA_ID=CAMNT_0043945793 /DNA_START=187 /DNA_END=1236 /DNA_ORIENTATION=-
MTSFGNVRSLRAASATLTISILLSSSLRTSQAFTTPLSVFVQPSFSSITTTSSSSSSSTARKLSLIDTTAFLTDILHSSSTILSDNIVIDYTTVDALQQSLDTTVKIIPPPTPETSTITEEFSNAASAAAAAATSVVTPPKAVTATAQGFSSTYSKASYYTTLGLYALSFPGIWSQIKRSTKAKTKRKTFVSDGESADGGKDLRQQAGEIMAYMKANNYEVVEAGEVITFRGLVKKSVSQACFLIFCTVLGMASLALVLQIQLQDFTIPFLGITPNWFYLVGLSPYAGIYYWKSGDRVDDVKVKLASSDDDVENEITIEGNDEELERMWRTLEWREKGMVKIEGLLEGT